MTASQGERCPYPDCGGGHGTKGERREAQARKERQGMQVTNTGIRKLPELAARPKGKRK